MTTLTTSVGRADSAPADLAPCSLRGAWMCACGGAWRVHASWRRKAPGPPSPHPSRQVQTRELRPVSRFCEAHLRPLAGRFGTSLRSGTAAEGPSPCCRIWVVLNSGDAGGMRSEAGAHPEEWACVGQPRRGMPRSSVLSSALSVCLPSPLLPHSQLLGTCAGHTISKQRHQDLPLLVWKFYF